jgi:hypothetical protein
MLNFGWANIFMIFILKIIKLHLSKLPVLVLLENGIPNSWFLEQIIKF